MNRHYRAAAFAATEMQAETSAIRKVMKKYALKPLHVHLALDVPVTTDGVLIRFIARHASYLRYVESAKTWQLYYTDSKTQVGGWTNVEQYRVEQLLLKLIEQMKAENDIIDGAVASGIIRHKPEGYVRHLTIFVDALKNNRTEVLQIIEKLKVELDFNGIYVAPERAACNVSAQLLK